VRVTGVQAGEQAAPAAGKRQSEGRGEDMVGAWETLSVRLLPGKAPSARAAGPVSYQC